MVRHELDVNINVHGRIRVDVYVHTQPEHRQIVGTWFHLNQQGDPMSGVISIDNEAATATLSFVDDHGDTDATQPAGSSVVFASDNTTVATIAADANNPLQADITPVAEGVVNFTASVLDSTGAPLFPDATVNVTVGPGVTEGDAFSLSVNAPQV